MIATERGTMFVVLIPSSPQLPRSAPAQNQPNPTRPMHQNASGCIIHAECEISLTHLHIPLPSFPRPFHVVCMSVPCRFYVALGRLPVAFRRFAPLGIRTPKTQPQPSPILTISTSPKTLFSHPISSHSPNFPPRTAANPPCATSSPPPPPSSPPPSPFPPPPNSPVTNRPPPPPSRGAKPTSPP